MTDRVLTEVMAEVAPERAADVAPAFRALLDKGLPTGLLRTELLAGPNGVWRIQSLWRDRAALEAVRAGSEPPAAPALFRRLGAEPTLTILTVRESSA